MFELKIIAHRNIIQSDFNEIFEVKSVAWPYPRESQLKWLNENLKDEDLHLLLQTNKKTVAYLNLIKIELKINNKKIKSYGIGNVCSIEKGKGYGFELMKLTNQFIAETLNPGLLFCKPELIRFYEKFNWKVIEKNKIKLAFNNQDVETMYFNFGKNLHSLTYLGASF